LAADSNPVHSSTWRALQQLVYCNRRIRDVEQLKEVVQTCWEQIGQDVIDRAIGQSRKRLSAQALPVRPPDALRRRTHLSGGRADSTHTVTPDKTRLSRLPVDRRRDAGHAGSYA